MAHEWGMRDVGDVFEAATSAAKPLTLIFDTTLGNLTIELPLNGTVDVTAHIKLTNDQPEKYTVGKLQ